MKVLITGSNGLLGYKLVELLPSQGISVIATSRGSSRLGDTMEYDYASMDIRKKEDIERVLEKYQPDTLINTAAMTQVDDCETQREDCWDLNVTAVQNLVEVSQKYHLHFIHLSTDFIFDGSEGPLSEEALPNPVNYYGSSKLKSEELIMNSSLDWSIVRTVLVYGVSPVLKRSNIILWVHEKLKAGEQIRVVDDQFRTPTLAEDLAMGCYLIAKNRSTGVFNISGKDMLTPYQMAVAVARYFKLDEGLIVRTTSDEFKQPAPRPLRTGFIIDKAIKQLNYQPRSFNEGIKIISDQFL